MKDAEAAKQKKAWRKRLRHRSLEGMTLVEIMVVMIIMAMISTGVALVVVNQLNKAKLKQAEIDAGKIQQAAEMWVLDNSSECPTVATLVESGEIRAATPDPWGEEFIIACEGSSITVSSKGPDKQGGTDDDITK